MKLAVAGKDLGIRLPWSRILGGRLTVTVDHMPERRLDEAVDLLTTAADNGDGLSEDEFPAGHSVEDMIRGKTGWRSFWAQNRHTGSMVSAMIIKDSPLCRSRRPLYEAGYLVVAPNYRSMGLGAEYINLRLSLGHALGYEKTLGRTAITARTLIPLKKLNTIFCGVIPDSVRRPDSGFVDDLIVWTGPSPTTQPDLVLPEPSLPPLRVTDAVPSLLQSPPLDPSYQFPPLRHGSNELHVSHAAGKHIWQVEEMIRNAAEEGQGFALDEFNKDGHFERKFLCPARTLVLTSSPDGDVVAAAMYGQSTICRSENAQHATVYVIVRADQRNQGLGAAMLKYMVDHAPTFGYRGILSDIFITQSKAINLANKAGFVSVGMFPKCATLRGTGWTDSLLMFRSLS